MRGHEIEFVRLLRAVYESRLMAGGGVPKRGDVSVAIVCLFGFVGLIRVCLLK